MDEPGSGHSRRRDNARRLLPWGFDETELVVPTDSFLTDIQIELREKVSHASGQGADGLAYLDDDEVRAFVAGVAGWYAMHYGRPATDSKEYTLEIAGIAELIAPHVIEVPNHIQQLAPEQVRGMHVPYPSAAHVLGFEL